MTRQTAPIILAMVMVLIALSAIIYMARMPNHHSQYVTAASPDLPQVVYADRDIPADHVITADDVVELPIQTDFVVAGALPCQDLVIGAKTRQKIEFRTEINGKDLFDASGKRLVPESSESKITAADKVKACRHSHGNLLDLSPNKTFVVVEDVPEGAIISGKVLLEKQASDAPDDAAHSLWQIVGRPSKYGLFEGNVASEFDADHDGKVPVSVVIADRDLAKDEAITKEDLKTVTMPAARCPGTAMTGPELLIGCKAHVDIAKGTIVRAFHVDTPAN